MASFSPRMLVLVLGILFALFMYTGAGPLCNSQTYEDGSRYASNLKGVIKELRQGYTTGQRINPDVRGKVLCYRSQEECISCANTLLDKVTDACDHNKGAQLSNSVCSVRYEPYVF